MKKNFLVSTGLIDTWEFEENNFLLGRWCEFYEFDDLEKKKFKEKILMTNIIKNNSHHWEDNEKIIKDYEYIKKKLEYLLEIISEKLSTIHNVNESKEYWRIVIYTWLNYYTSTIFDRWENIRIFFEKNKTEKFYSNFILLDDLDYIPINFNDFIDNSQKDEWNHLIFLRLFHFLTIPNLSLIKKKDTRDDIKKMINHTDIRKQLNLSESFSLVNRVISIIDNIISRFAFKFNKIIFESFYFPKKEYLKICLKYKLIPSKYSNIFDFNINENNLSQDNKRIKFKNLLSKVDTQDRFIKFLLQNLHKDIPRSYLENFDAIKKKILPFSKKKKIIFSMHSITANDNFKIFIAETKKAGSKYIHAAHGGGLTFRIPSYPLFAPGHFDFFEKVSDKIISWDNTEQEQNIFVNLSPTLPIINLKNDKIGNNCSIVFVETKKYEINFLGIGLNRSINYFNELIQFANNLDPAIKSKMKFRSKANHSYNSEKRFSEMFGEESIDKNSSNNPFKNTILNSKLIIVTYPETVFSEAMYSNTPTILIINKNCWQFSKAAQHTFNVLKKNKIAFEDFDEAKNHINKYWKELDLWWKNENVQSARKSYLVNFFNVKPDWYREWSDYIHSSLFS